MFNVPNCTLAITYKCCDLRFENSQVDVQGIGGNCTAFIPAGSRWGVFLSIHLKQKGGRKQAGTSLLYIFALRCLCMKWKIQEVCVRVILPSLCLLYEMSPDGDWFFKCWHPCLRSTPPFYTHTYIYTDTNSLTHTHSLLCAKQVRHTNISVPSSLSLPVTTIDWQKYACKQIDTHTITHTCMQEHTYSCPSTQAQATKNLNNNNNNNKSPRKSNSKKILLKLLMS